jgi:LysM repeat protein
MQPGDTVYMVRSNDTLDKVARKFNISPDTLITANNLKGGKITPGKRMIIPTHKEVKLAASGRSRPILPNETLYKVRRGDTIAKIAKRFRTSPAAIRIANLVDDSSLTEGINLVIPKPIRS